MNLERTKKLEVMVWPPQSPDLNPIELLYAGMSSIALYEKYVLHRKQAYGVFFNKNGRKFQQIH